MRPIPLDDAAHPISDGGNVILGLDLLTEHFEFFRAQGAAEHEFRERLTRRAFSRPPPTAKSGSRALHLQRDAASGIARSKKG